MNIATVTIAEGNIGLSARLRATAIEIAEGKRPTAESDSRIVRKDGVGGA
jgi:hypothetical protein